MKQCVNILMISILIAGISCSKSQIENKSERQIATINSDASAVVPEPLSIYTAVKYPVNPDCAGFMQAIPASYWQSTKSFPLIVFIHGINELGTNLPALNCCGLPYHLYHKTFPASFTVGGVKYSFLVIAPQFKKRPTPAEVQSVIDFAKRRWRVDATRVYVAGLSMGGGSTWDWSAIYGKNAAAIVPVCGGTKPNTTMAANIASKNLPIWGLYSTKDALVPVQWGKDFFDWIDAYNPSGAWKTKLTIWTDADHNSTWARACNPATRIDGYNIYEWMLLFRRPVPGK